MCFLIDIYDAVFDQLLIDLTGIILSCIVIIIIYRYPVIVQFGLQRIDILLYIRFRKIPLDKGL